MVAIKLFSISLRAVGTVEGWRRAADGDDIYLMTCATSTADWALSFRDAAALRLAIRFRSTTPGVMFERRTDSAEVIIRLTALDDGGVRFEFFDMPPAHLSPRDGQRLLTGLQRFGADMADIGAGNSLGLAQ
jgi:hypothetical protein